MFPNTSKIDEKIDRLRAGGATPLTSPDMRQLVIAQASAWFPGTEKLGLAEECLVDRGMIPSKDKMKKTVFASGGVQKRVLAFLPRQ